MSTAPVVHIDPAAFNADPYPALKSMRANTSLISVQMVAGLVDEPMRTNVKLAISGGQNEPGDAIAGTIWALLKQPVGWAFRGLTTLPCVWDV